MGQTDLSLRLWLFAWAAALAIPIVFVSLLAINDVSFLNVLIWATVAPPLLLGMIALFLIRYQRKR
jgi:hypothetical protein